MRYWVWLILLGCSESSPGPRMDVAEPGDGDGEPALDLDRRDAAPTPEPDGETVPPDSAPDLGTICARGAERPCYGGPAETLDRGRCRAGQQICEGEAWSPCVGQILPGDETCDGTDEDCNGIADDLRARGQACQVGMGACTAVGVTFCDLNGALACSATPGEPGLEQCNQRDDDCDGVMDEELVRPCSVGIGACRVEGLTACSANGMMCIAEAAAPAAERCNDLDDDCDDRVDEAFSVGAACIAGLGLCARAGHVVCGALDAGMCDAIPGVPADETCDEMDNDCDGQTDEGHGRGNGCFLGQGVCRRPGQIVCDGAGGALCDAMPSVPGEETCNSSDDDCDGRVDEGLHLGEACTNGLGPCERAGVRVCGAAGAVVCDAVPAEGQPETCDRTDEDCDGIADDNLVCIRPFAGENHICAIIHGDTLKCWGRNDSGQLGLGDTRDRGTFRRQMGEDLRAVDVQGGPVTEVGAGDRHTCALLSEGQVRCWGSNGLGELGLGDVEDRGDEAGEMGIRLPALDLGTGEWASGVAADNHRTCAILGAGRLKCWGNNSNGRLGLGDTLHRGGAPGDMGDALPFVDPGGPVRAVSLGFHHTCALLADGSLKCWGENQYGQLGLGDVLTRGDEPGEMGDALPAVDLGAGRHAVAVAAAMEHTCALLDDGHVKCWGRNRVGELGLGDVDNRGDQPGEMGDALPNVDLGRLVVDLGVGLAHTCALMDDGAVKCWGSNSAGELGQEDQENRGDEGGEMAALQPVDLGANRRVLALTVGRSFACAMLDDARMKCWGANNSGQLGLEDRLNRGQAPNEMGDDLPAVRLE